MIELSSHVGGQWAKANGRGGRAATLVNPATGEPLATAGTDGIDMKAALAFTRAAGAELRRRTFAERGEIVRAMSRAIHAHRDELIGLAIANGGNTRSDAKFDIDGASGTLAAYADLGAELGDARALLDGDPIQLGRSARLFGQHVLVAREGAAVHINAFNFPAWGLAEKAAVAILAGVPVLTKPATSTALVSHRIVQIFVEENVLPPGALSFLAGSAGDLLDHLGGQDVLAFTGSSGTGKGLRGTDAILSHSVRVNVEADSLNAAVVGPDVEVGSDLWNLVVADVSRDMTQKTGQKCTAIRRVYAPAARVDELLAALRARLEAIKVGDPAREDVTMGPLATAQQQRDIRAGIGMLAECAQIVFGSATEVSLLGASADKGFFVSPVLLHGKQPDARDAVHNHEVFGPVCTVMPYDGTAGAASTLVRAGAGGLVSSVYSDEKAFVRDAVLGIAPYHGRVTVGSSKVASQAIPPGTVLPQLVHGGPGRAGGGEELGARRGLGFYMQRVALQGDRALLEAVTAKG
jgi:oxepin-CoA hydrolase/3-oxo-5,6-dehydrosuberyl-CoA semialdehyde dehydrogenase